VVVTNGDGFPKAAAVITKKPQDQLVPTDFIKLTGIRQQHTLTAMKQIGVKAAELVFLGYPDTVQAAEWHGTIFTYLVHGHTLPEGRVVRLPLTTEESEKKRATIEEYAKHTSPIQDRLAEKFTKPEEGFCPICIE